jgi:hypothetical protein
MKRRTAVLAASCLAPLVGLVSTAGAQSPPPDSSPGFFAGEWAGPAELGGYCYLRLARDGTGVVLVDAGAGDWLGARIQWHNERQALQLDKVMPLAASPQRRLMPLQGLTLQAGLGQSMALGWGGRAAGCQLQKIEATEAHLQRARQVVRELPASTGTGKP